MSMPFYVSPEQVIADKVKFAKNGIAQGRSIVAMQYAEGILLAAENQSRLLHKISEIYDCIAFAGVGKYNEFDSLRQAGVRSADIKGYQYSREDVDARSLASSYGQILGQIFTHEMKPYEVEILVAEVGDTPESDELYFVQFNGVVVDQSHFTVLGGESENILERVKTAWSENLSLADALKAAVAALAGPDRTLAASDMEIGVLDRALSRRKFRRLEDDDIASLLG
ncbi:MAG: proteasome subunit alpha [Acidimicrobiales bacterium]